MRIARKEIARISGSLAGKAENARASYTEREGILLRLTDEEGRTGLGEASPLPGYSQDTAAECARTLSDLPVEAIRPRLPEEPLETWLESATRLVDPQTPAARFALETALLDLAAQEERVSIAELLRGGPPDRPVPLAALVQEDEPAAAVEEVARILERKIFTIKIKIGRRGQFERELERVREVRRAFGSACRLRLDANGAWDLVESSERLRALASLEPEFVEQPVIPYLLLKMGPSPVPIAADETLSLPGAAERLSLVPACRVFVLKPAVLGGFLPTLRIARIGKARRLGLVVTHLFDGPVALAAAAELACALPAEPLACGLDLHAGLSIWPETPVPQIRGNEIRPSLHPGLGIHWPEKMP
jgi:o-succinylbenzoate synthase